MLSRKSATKRGGDCSPPLFVLSVVFRIRPILGGGSRKKAAFDHLPLWGVNAPRAGAWSAFDDEHFEIYSFVR